MNMIRKRFTILFFIIFMFCAIFTPDFFSFSMRYLIVIISIIGVAWGSVSTGKLRIDKCNYSIIKGFLPFMLYFVFSQFLRCVFDSSNSSIYISTLGHTLLAFFGALLICMFIVQTCKKKDISFDNFIYIILLVMIIQLACVVLALTVPSVRQYFNMLIINNSYSDRLAELARASLSGWADRSYGLSNNLFDSFGYITSMLIVLIFAYGMEKSNNKLIILSVIFVLMPLVNARTGIVLVLIGFFIVGVFYNDIRAVLKISGIVILSVVALVLLLNQLPDLMVKWLTSGLEETLSLFNRSGKTGVYSEIFGSDLSFPPSVLLGAGGAPSAFSHGGVDNGYINCLWYFGLIGTILLFAGYINMFHVLRKNTQSKLYKVISVVLITIFFVYQLKIYSIDNFGGNVIIFGVPTLIIALQQSRDNVEELK